MSFLDTQDLLTNSSSSSAPRLGYNMPQLWGPAFALGLLLCARMFHGSKLASQLAPSLASPENSAGLSESHPPQDTEQKTREVRSYTQRSFEQWFCDVFSVIVAPPISDRQVLVCLSLTFRFSKRCQRWFGPPFQVLYRLRDDVVPHRGGAARKRERGKNPAPMIWEP